MEMAQEMLSSREVQVLIEKARVLKAKLEILASDPAVREGGEATLRTAINAAIAIADTFPGAGAVGSWGADAAKVWTRYEHMKKIAEAAARGEDTSKVKKSVLDLTPDVSIKVAVGSEALELISADVFPTHAIESTMQLKHDWPRIKKAAERAREIFSGEATVKPDEAAAAAAFDVSLQS